MLLLHVPILLPPKLKVQALSVAPRSHAESQKFQEDQGSPFIFMIILPTKSLLESYLVTNPSSSPITRKHAQACNLQVRDSHTRLRQSKLHTDVSRCPDVPVTLLCCATTPPCHSSSVGFFLTLSLLIFNCVCYMHIRVYACYTGEG